MLQMKSNRRHVLRDASTTARPGSHAADRAIPRALESRRARQAEGDRARRRSGPAKPRLRIDHALLLDLGRYPPRRAAGILHTAALVGVLFLHRLLHRCRARRERALVCRVHIRARRHARETATGGQPSAPSAIITTVSSMRTSACMILPAGSANRRSSTAPKTRSQELDRGGRAVDDQIRRDSSCSRRVYTIP